MERVVKATENGDMERVVKATENIIGEEMPRNSVSFQTVGRTAASIILLFLVAPDGPQYPLLSMALIMDEPDDALNRTATPPRLDGFSHFLVAL
ncbi:hypothetical protein GQ600_11417 [Phytophthora cactorum]|nr:hypothetical protein GQ600_11417 [Phytophthora cactorum]